MVVKERLRLRVGSGTVIEENAILGEMHPGWKAPTIIGSGCCVRRFSLIFTDTEVGDHTMTGVGVVIREHTRIGSGCIIGTNTIIEGNVDIGDEVIIQSGVFIPTMTKIGDRVFIGPRAVLTNDAYPLRQRAEYIPMGPELGDDVTIGANATLLPGVRIGKGAMVAAGAVVTHDVPAWNLAVGVPARIRDLPEKLRELNQVRRRCG